MGLLLYRVPGSPLYASIFEYAILSGFCKGANVRRRIPIAIMMSFTARGLSITGNLFCYAAITSSRVIDILPGYLICTSIYSSVFVSYLNLEQVFRIDLNHCLWEYGPLLQVYPLLVRNHSHFVSFPSAD